jgi:hypothetical protein
MIHVTLSWRLIIHRVFLPWIDDIVDPVDAYMAAFYWLGLNCLDHGDVLSSLFLCQITAFIFALPLVEFISISPILLWMHSFCGKMRELTALK